MKILSLILLLLSPLSFVAATETDKADPPPAMSMGNGDHNWISVDESSRAGNVLKFAEVQIETNGWLVMHPFEDGKPNGDKYVAATFVEQGVNQNVTIEVYKGIESGEQFIVMLHKDSNSNEAFDFVFVDDRNVMDKAMFEGSKMIGHIFVAP
ncbi:MAG: hypothetical protein ACI96M_001166 [Candidatus Azotimanducaceae bacterium]|jgi:hypothetical protein